jgi:two-component system, cell cycle response regulator DivK
MAGESILVIDDTPVNLKLTRILLANEGYEVRTAPDAEQALSMLDAFRPDLMLVDIQLPGMDGLEFTRKVKANPKMAGVVVVALTAFAMKGDEERAAEAGCDGYITKPIDTRALPIRVREYLDKRKPVAVPVAARPQPEAKAAPAADNFGLAGPEVENLRQRFLAEGAQQSRDMLDTLGFGFNQTEARKIMHQWVGAAGLLGYREISSLSRELEQLLQDRPLDNAQVRELLTALVYAYSSPPEETPRPVPAAISEAIGGRRIALVGFAGAEADRMCKSLGRAAALPRLVAASEPPDSETIRGCDVVMIQVSSDTLSSMWLEARPARVSGKPTVLVGDRETLLSLDGQVQDRACEFLMDAWHPEEALLRACRALNGARLEASRPAAGTRLFPPPRTRPQIVLADDDVTVLSLVRATLLNYGMDVRAASNGIEALDKLREQTPDAAILDVNMPGMDGFELLSRIRAEKMPVRVILLTARQQESDVVRGFSLGADDYMVKPFSPLELVARVKRLLQR